MTNFQNISPLAASPPPKIPKPKVKRLPEAERKLRKLIREVVGAHKSCKIEIDKNIKDRYPELVGQPFSYIFPTPVWITSNGRKNRCSVYPAYVGSTQRIEIGEDFIVNMRTVAAKQAGNYTLMIDERPIKMPNFNMVKFLMTKCPNKLTEFKLV
jgi:hypothetical protein